MVTLNNASLLKNANYLAEQTKACRGKPVFFAEESMFEQCIIIEKCKSNIDAFYPQQ